ncbi:MAG: hypothetical protein NUV96_00095 [Candidatus Colwellbacteria bacterium]|nr:hypothetical protein [Candidatus Colwellbacteria bacterium]
MNNSSFGCAVVLVTILAIAGGIAVGISAHNDEQRMGEEYFSTSTTTMPGADLEARSPIHPCAATMAEIRPGTEVEVYNLEYGLLYSGEVTSWPYPISIGNAGDAHYVVDIDVEEDQNWPDGYDFLGHMGLLPYIPVGAWNQANFTVLEGSCDSPLPVGG